MSEEHSEVTAVERIRQSLEFQFQISWQLLQYHLDGLQDEEFEWRPADKGLHIWREAGSWRADWPDTESYDIGPPSIAWLTWHITYWWSLVLDHSFGHGRLVREDIRPSGTVQEAKERIERLCDEWGRAVAALPDEELLAVKRTRWPFEERPFHELAAWLNLELMKNAAEIGACRFHYGARPK